jgi:U3 small nucleolar RNA-associated protein 13
MILFACLRSAVGRIVDIWFIYQFLQALIPYTQRHFQRVDKLVQKSFIIDYTLQAMQILDDMAIDEFVALIEVHVASAY